MIRLWKRVLAYRVGRIVFGAAAGAALLLLLTQVTQSLGFG